MHILYLIDGLSLGGAETIVVNTLNYIKKNHPKIEVSLITTLTVEGHLIHKLDAAINYEHVNCKRTNFINGIIKLRKYVQNNNVTHVHSHLYHSIIVGRFVKNSKTLLFETFHNLEYKKDSVFFSRRLVVLDILTYKKKSVSIYVSEEVAQSIQRIRNKNNKFIVLSNFAGLDFNYDYHFKNDNSLKLIAIGNFKADKNFKYALAAFNTLKSYPISLDIYGEGLLRTELEQLIKESNVRVRLMGRQQMNVQILSGYDAFLMTSFNEGMPISLLEALGVGLPCILPNHLKIMKEVAQKSAVYYSINDCNELSNLLIEIFKNKQLLITMSKEASMRSKLYNIDSHVSTLFDLYLENKKF